MVTPSGRSRGSTLVLWCARSDRERLPTHRIQQRGFSHRNCDQSRSEQGCYRWRRGQRFRPLPSAVQATDLKRSAPAPDRLIGFGCSGPRCGRRYGTRWDWKWCGETKRGSAFASRTGYREWGSLQRPQCSSQPPSREDLQWADTPSSDLKYCSAHDAGNHSIECLPLSADRSRVLANRGATAAGRKSPDVGQQKQHCDHTAS